MTLTLKLSMRVPGKPLTVDGEARIDMKILAGKPDKGQFLLNAVEKLRERIIIEVAKKSKQPATVPSRD